MMADLQAGMITPIAKVSVGRDDDEDAVTSAPVCVKGPTGNHGGHVPAGGQASGRTEGVAQCGPRG